MELLKPVGKILTMSCLTPQSALRGSTQVQQFDVMRQSMLSCPLLLFSACGELQTEFKGCTLQATYLHSLGQ